MTRILIVDDDPLMISLETAILTHFCHFEVESTSHTDQAFAALKTGRFDLALVDVSIQEDADGVGLAQQIKGEALTGKIPVLLVTAYARRDSDRAKLMNESGADDCLSKPFASPRDLMEPVQKWLSVVSKGRLVA